jgi:hypothetical protein
MIRYTLICDSGHGFDGWFQSSAGFEDQVRLGFVSCPICQSLKVEKAIMAPSVARTDYARRGLEGARVQDNQAASAAVSVEVAPAAAVAAEDVSVTLITPEAQELRAAFKALRAHVKAHSDYVGPRFADEARAMHEGEIETRSIYGEATPDEVRELYEDGIGALPLPILPEDRN